MLKKGKKFMAFVMASMFAVTFSLSACQPGNKVSLVPPKADPVEEYAVTLEYNDGVSKARTVYVEAGEKLAEPAVPTRVGFEHTEWTTTEKGGSKVSFPYTPTADTTIYAQWEAAKYDVTFDFNFEGAPDAVVLEKEYNTEVTAAEVEAIAIPEYRGYNFRRWETKAENGDVAEWPFLVKKDATFFAAWMEEGKVELTVHFDANYEGAAAINPIVVAEGESIEERTIARFEPTRPGCTFLGWALTASEDATVDDIIEFPYTPTKEEADENYNITLYAVWERGIYQVRFNYNYTGSPSGFYVEMKDVLGGTPIEAPETPKRVQDGFTFEFDGWYTSDVGGVKMQFPYLLAQTVNLYAHWRAPLAETNIFDAEFTPIDPLKVYHGYSGEVHGTECIQTDLEGSHSEKYPDLYGYGQEGHYVGWQYEKGCTLTFVINSDKAVSGAAIFACLASELGDFTMGPDGNYGFQFIVNGTPLAYTPFAVGEEFKEYRLSTAISLKQGENVIQLVVNNETPAGGTMAAYAPLIDYIRLDSLGGAKLSWYPEYDNLYRPM